MKNKFSGFYSPSSTILSDVWNSEKTLFIFDTNVLLDLYSYTPNVKDDFFKVLEIISDRVWIPYHVALEYQRNRLSIIRNEKKIIEILEYHLEIVSKKLENNNYLNLKLDNHFPDIYTEYQILIKNFQESFKKIKHDIQKHNSKKLDVRSEDMIRKMIDKYFSDSKIGNPFDQEKLDDIYKDGEKRYSYQIPPGYKDEKKEHEDIYTYNGLYYNAKFDNLIIWKQIIEKAKEINIDNILFITNDKKEDWLYKVDSREKEIIGARAELRSEIEKESAIKVFDIVTLSDFLKEAKEKLDLNISEEVILEIEDNTHAKIVMYLNEIYKKQQLEMFKCEQEELKKMIDNIILKYDENNVEAIE